MQSLAQTCEDTLIVCGYSADFDLAKGFRNCCTGTKQSEGFSCFKINPMAVFKKQNQFDAAGKLPLVLSTLGSLLSTLGYHGGIYYILDARPSDDYEHVLFLERPTAGFKVTLYYGDTDSDPLNPALFIGPASHSVVSIMAEKTRTKSRSAGQGGVRFYDPPLPCRNYTDYEYVDARKCRRQS